MGLILAVGVITVSFWDGMNKNWATLDADAVDPSLAALVVPVEPAQAVRKAAEVIPTLSRWAVVASDPGAGTLHATHTTLVWRFVDDIRLSFAPEPGRPGWTRISGRSQSRVGKGDLGQNARNLRALRAALESRLAAAATAPGVARER